MPRGDPELVPTLHDERGTEDLERGLSASALVARDGPVPCSLESEATPSEIAPRVE